MFQITKFTLSDRINYLPPLNVLMVGLKMYEYCGPDKFNGPSKFGQYDGVKNRAPLPYFYSR